MMMMGMSRVRSPARSSRQTSVPLIPGSMMSSRIRSGKQRLRLAKPFLAIVGHDGLVPLAVEVVGQHVHQVALVLDDQDAQPGRGRCGLGGHGNSGSSHRDYSPLNSVPRDPCERGGHRPSGSLIRPTTGGDGRSLLDQVDHVLGDIRRVVGDALQVARRREHRQTRLDHGRATIASTRSRS